MFHDEAAARSAWAKTMAFLAEHLPVRSRAGADVRPADPTPRWPRAASRRPWPVVRSSPDSGPPVRIRSPATRSTAISAWRCLTIAWRLTADPPASWVAVCGPSWTRRSSSRRPGRIGERAEQVVERSTAHAATSIGRTAPRMWRRAGQAVVTAAADKRGAGRERLDDLEHGPVPRRDDDEVDRGRLDRVARLATTRTRPVRPWSTRSIRTSRSSSPSVTRPVAPGHDVRRRRRRPSSRPSARRRRSTPRVRPARDRARRSGDGDVGCPRAPR